MQQRIATTCVPALTATPGLAILTQRIGGADATLAIVDSIVTSLMLIALMVRNIMLLFKVVLGAILVLILTARLTIYAPFALADRTRTRITVAFAWIALERRAPAFRIALAFPAGIL